MRSLCSLHVFAFLWVSVGRLFNIVVAFTGKLHPWKHMIWNFGFMLWKITETTMAIFWIKESGCFIIGMKIEARSPSGLFSIVTVAIFRARWFFAVPADSEPERLWQPPIYVFTSSKDWLKFVIGDVGSSYHGENSSSKATTTATAATTASDDLKCLCASLSVSTNDRCCRMVLEWS